jgi:hypothetical protein
VAEQNFSDQLWNGLADAVADIREKVVEEPMWGRSLGDDAAPQWPEAREAEPEPTHTMEQEQEHTAPEQDIER